MEMENQFSLPPLPKVKRWSEIYNQKKGLISS